MTQVFGNEPVLGIPLKETIIGDCLILGAIPSFPGEPARQARQARQGLPLILDTFNPGFPLQEPEDQVSQAGDLIPSSAFCSVWRPPAIWVCLKIGNPPKWCGFFFWFRFNTNQKGVPQKRHSHAEALHTCPYMSHNQNPGR